MTPTFFFVTGVAMLVLGVTGLSYLRRRKVHRRTLVGVEQFAGYGKMMTVKARENRIEAMSRFLTAFGLLMAIVAYIKF